MIRMTLCAMALVLAPAAREAGPVDVPAGTVPDRVEEDWVLVVDNPDIPGVGPQVTTSMSPVADLKSAPFVAFDMNYREYPAFSPGGMQLQVWSGKALIGYDTSRSEQFATQGETVSWTQRMSLSGGRVTYEVPAGSSTTWGTFGDDLTISFATTATDLSGYSPATTVANSGVSWQVNNVKSLTLAAVRYYANGQLLSTDSTSRPLVSNGAAVTTQP